jgi:hypothetical protein
MKEKKASPPKTWQCCKYKLHKHTHRNGKSQWILYYRLQSKSTLKFGHREKWAIKEIVPQWIFSRTTARTYQEFKHLTAEIINRSEHFGNAVRWYCHGNPLAVIVISDMTDKPSSFDNQRIAQELRDATTKSGERFRRLDKCPAPFRLAYVVRAGGFCRLVPWLKKEHHHG